MGSGASRQSSPGLGTRDQPAAPSATEIRRWLLSLGAVLVCLVLAAWSAPLLKSVPPQVGFLIAFCAVCAGVLLVAWACPALPPKALGFLLLPAAVLVGAAWSGGHGLLLVMVVSAALLLGTTLLGNVIGSAVEHPGQIVFVALVGSALDVLSVLHPRGVSAAIAQSEAALSVVALAWPLFGTKDLIPLLGGGDVVFTALYVAAARKHRLSVARTVSALAVGYAVTLIAVATLQQALPALPFLGAAVVLAEPAARRPAEKDRKRGYVIAATVVALVAVLLLKA